MKINDQQRYDLELRILYVLDRLKRITRDKQLQELIKQRPPLSKTDDERISKTVENA